MNLKLIIATGGTGGHFFPSLAIAQKHKELGEDVSLYISGKNSSEQKIEATNSEIPVEIGKTFPWPVPWYKKPFTFLCFLKSLRVAQKYLKVENPDAVLAMGSFASVPLGLAASLAGIPLFLHDGNTIAGRANRTLSSKAQCLFTSFPLANETAIKCTTHLSGVPLRQKLLKFALEKNNQKQDAFEQLQLSQKNKTLLIFGGSQGAKFINEIMTTTLKNMNAEDNLQVIHLTGSDDNSKIKEIYKTSNLPAIVLKNSLEIEQLYQIADLVICRGGASTLAELAVFAKPAIIIPLPSSMDNHQFYNAQMAKNAGAAIILEEKNCSTEKLNELLKKTLNEETLLQMSQNMKNIATPNAAENLLKHITKTVYK